MGVVSMLVALVDMQHRCTLDLPQALRAAGCFMFVGMQQAGCCCCWPCLSIAKFHRALQQEVVSQVCRAVLPQLVS